MRLVARNVAGDGSRQNVGTAAKYSNTSNFSECVPVHPCLLTAWMTPSRPARGIRDDGVREMVCPQRALVPPSSAVDSPRRSGIAQRQTKPATSHRYALDSLVMGRAGVFASLRAASRGPRVIRPSMGADLLSHAEAEHRHGPDCLLVNGSRSILPRPEVEKRTPSPSNTGRTYASTSSTSPRCRHWLARSAPRISRFFPPAAARAVATASARSQGER